MKQLKFILIILTYGLSLKSSWSYDDFHLDHLYGEQKAKILTSSGEVYLENSRKKEIFTGDVLRSGDTIITTQASRVVLVFKSNGLIILGPSSRLRIGKSSKNGLQHVVFEGGHLYFQKRPQDFQRPDGVIVSVSGNPNHAYMADIFELEQTPELNALTLLQGELKIINF